MEFGLTLPPLVVVFQFNPVQLTRNRSLTYAVPNPPPAASGTQAVATRQTTLRQFHSREEFSDLTELQKQQIVTVQEESIGFDIRLDATDKLNDGTLSPRSSASLLISPPWSWMVHPKGESLIGQALGALLGSPGGFSFTKGENPPLVLLIWGRKRVLPVNINSMNITETQFSTDLNPIRASVAVNLTVIEGKSIPYMYSKAMKEAMSVLNLANITDIADVMIPG